MLPRNRPSGYPQAGGEPQLWTDEYTRSHPASRSNRAAARVNSGEVNPRLNDEYTLRDVASKPTRAAPSLVR